MNTERTLLAAALALALAAGPLAAQSGTEAPATNQRIEEVVAKACEGLKNLQREDGSWADYGGYPGATTALVVQALLLAGEPFDSPCIQKAAIALTKYEIDRTYSSGCRAMAYALLVPHYPQLRPRLQAEARWLSGQQLSNGMWGYGPGSSDGRGDNSNTQFAVIGLRDASLVNVEVSDMVWQRLWKHYTTTQLPDGGWSYKAPDRSQKEADLPNSSVTITAPSLASLMIVSDELLRASGCPCQDGRSKPGKLDEKYVEKGIQWLIDFFEGKASAGSPEMEKWQTYFYYGLQRAGQASGLKTFGPHDWYKRGSSAMCGMGGRECLRPFIETVDDPDNPANKSRKDYTPPQVVIKKDGKTERKYVVDAPLLVNVSLAVIFLVKGNAPVFMNKLKYEGDWNRHRRDMALVTQEVGKRLERPFRWQVVDSRSDARSWHDSPLLYLSGEDTLKLADEEKKKLADFCMSGGTLLVEANCGNIAFSEKFRSLAKELWPDWPLEVLPKEHDIYSCQLQVDSPGLLEGIQDGIRTIVFFTNKDFSCAWQMRDVEKNKPKFDLALNLYAYATDKAPPPARLAEVEKRLQERRQALEDWKKAVAAERDQARKEKRQPRRIPKPGRQTQEELEVDLALAKAGTKKLINLNLLKHQGDYAAGLHYQVLSKLIAEFQKRLGVTLALGDAVGPAEIDPGMPDVLLVRGDRPLGLSAQDKARLADYLRKGGFVIAEAVMGRKAFDDDFQKFIKDSPGLELVPLKADDPLLTGEIDQGIDGIELSTCQFTRTVREEQPGIKTPIVLAIKANGKLAGYYSPLDLTYSTTGLVAYGIRGYDGNSALALLINIFLKTTKG